MHQTALRNCQRFFDTYSSSFDQDESVSVLEIGSRKVDDDSMLRDVVPKTFYYQGVDMMPGKNVDVVLADPYILPFENESVDIIISSSCFEHSEMFWLIFLEILRILRPTGLFYLNVPSNGYFHRFPVDCWRFYPDSGKALVTWAQRNAMSPALLESYINLRGPGVWNDFVGVFLKDETYVHKFPNRIIDNFKYFYNGHRFGSDTVINQEILTEEQKILATLVNN